MNEGWVVRGPDGKEYEVLKRNQHIMPDGKGGLTRLVDGDFVLTVRRKRKQTGFECVSDLKDCKYRCVVITDEEKPPIGFMTCSNKKIRPYYGGLTETYE